MAKIIEPDLIPMGQIVPLENKVWLYNTFTELITTCEQNKGIGLSAVQVGLPWKMFVIQDANVEQRYRCFLNCKYEPLTNSKRTLSLEGCLSLRSPDGRLRFFEVERWDRIKVSGTELDYRNLHIFDFILDVEAPASIIMQHEIDHDAGVLISNIGVEKYIFN